MTQTGSFFLPSLVVACVASLLLLDSRPYHTNMAPIPEEDNQDKPPNKEDTEISDFSNPNLVTHLDVASDFSEDSDDDNSSLGGDGGYVLLPQDPSEAGNDNSDSEDGEIYTSSPGNVEAQAVGGVPDTVLATEAEVSTPTVSASEAAASSHPDFLAKFPDGKVPSYMQVPSLPKEKSEQVKVWNDSRQAAEKSRICLDTAQESKILKAMSGFSLPTANIPSWAQGMSDDKWRQQVLDRIKHPVPTQDQPPVTASSKTEESSNEGWVADFPDD